MPAFCQPRRQDVLADRFVQEMADIFPVPRVILHDRDRDHRGAGPPGNVTAAVRPDHEDTGREQRRQPERQAIRRRLGLIQPVHHARPGGGPYLPGPGCGHAQQRLKPRRGLRPVWQHPARSLILQPGRPDQLRGQVLQRRPHRPACCVPGKMRQVPAGLDQPRRERGLAQPCLGGQEHIPARILCQRPGPPRRPATPGR